MQTQKVDISDLLPSLQSALTRYRKSRSSTDYWEYRDILKQIGDRYGIGIGQLVGVDNTNRLIGLLDRDYPDWRGYRVQYRMPPEKLCLVA